MPELRLAITQQQSVRSNELVRLKKKERKAFLWAPGLVLLWCFLTPLGDLLVMKTRDDEWYVVIKAYKLTVFEIWEIFLYCHILHVHAIPTLESTDSMIVVNWSINDSDSLHFWPLFLLNKDCVHTWMHAEEPRRKQVNTCQQECIVCKKMIQACGQVA